MNKQHCAAGQSNSFRALLGFCSLSPDISDCGMSGVSDLATLEYTEEKGLGVIDVATLE